MIGDDAYCDDYDSDFVKKQNKNKTWSRPEGIHLGNFFC